MLEDVLYDSLSSAFITRAVAAQPPSASRKVNDILHKSEDRAEKSVQEIDYRAENYVQQIQQTLVVTIATVVAVKQPVEQVKQDIQNI